MLPKQRAQTFTADFTVSTIITMVVKEKENIQNIDVLMEYDALMRHQLTC